jgi:hypothetical protein
MALRHALACLLVAPAALAALVDCNLAARLCAPQESRPSAAVCPVTQAPVGSPTACTTDTDCTGAGTSGPFCLGGTCGFDACLTDGDCSSGTLCACASEFYGGNGRHGNVCVAATCRVDADCGGGSICAPSRGYCGGFEGFHCVSAGTGGCDSGDSCQFVPETGHFECQQQPVCSG